MDIPFTPHFLANKTRQWTDEEDAWLKAHKDDPWEELERVLGRNQANIRSHMGVLLIKRSTTYNLNEHEVLDLLMKGKSHKEIAEALGATSTAVSSFIYKHKLRSRL